MRNSWSPVIMHSLLPSPFEAKYFPGFPLISTMSFSLDHCTIILFTYQSNYEDQKRCCNGNV